MDKVTAIAIMVSAFVFGILSTVSMLGKSRREVEDKKRDDQYSVLWKKDGKVLGIMDGNEKSVLIEIGHRMFTSAAFIKKMLKIAKSSSTHSTACKMKYYKMDDGFVDVVFKWIG